MRQEYLFSITVISNMQSSSFRNANINLVISGAKTSVQVVESFEHNLPHSSLSSIVSPAGADPARLGLRNHLPAQEGQRLAQRDGICGHVHAVGVLD